MRAAACGSLISTKSFLICILISLCQNVFCEQNSTSVRLFPAYKSAQANKSMGPNASKISLLDHPHLPLASLLADKQTPFSTINVNSSELASESRQEARFAPGSAVAFDDQVGENPTVAGSKSSPQSVQRMKGKIVQMLRKLDREKLANSSSNEPRLSMRSKKFLSLLKSKRSRLQFRVPPAEGKANAVDLQQNETATTTTSARPTLPSKIDEPQPKVASNISESASHKHERWVSLGERNEELARPLAQDSSHSLARRQEVEAEGAEEKEEEEDAGGQQEADSRARASRAQAMQAAAAAIVLAASSKPKRRQQQRTEAGNRLPPKLRAKIIERFLRSGGKAQNIAISDSTITTTSQSKRKTVTTVYRVVPALGGPGEGDLQQDSFGALDGAPKSQKLAPRLRKIQVTRVELPQSDFLDDDKQQKELDGQFGPQIDQEHSLGEFYRGPQAALGGREDAKLHVELGHRELDAGKQQTVVASDELEEQVGVSKRLAAGRRQRPKQLARAKSVAQVGQVAKLDEIGAGNLAALDSRRPRPGQSGPESVVGERKTKRKLKKDSLEQLKQLVSSGQQAESSFASGAPSERAETEPGRRKSTPSKGDSSPRVSSDGQNAANSTQQASASASKLIPTNPSSTSTTTTTSTSTTSTTRAPLVAAQKVEPSGPVELSGGAKSLGKLHNIMMLIDFGPAPGQAGPEQQQQQQEIRPVESAVRAGMRKLESQASSSATAAPAPAAHWSRPATTNQWRPMGESAPPAHPQHSPPPPPTVNVQIFNNQQPQRGPNAPLERPLFEASERAAAPSGAPPLLQQLGPRAEPAQWPGAREHHLPRTPGGYSSNGSLAAETLAAGPPWAPPPPLLLTPPVPLYSAPFIFASGRRRPAGAPALERQPLESSQARAFLPNESAQTNQLIQQVIDQISAAAAAGERQQQQQLVGGAPGLQVGADREWSHEQDQNGRQLFGEHLNGQEEEEQEEPLSAALVDSPKFAGAIQHQAGRQHLLPAGLRRRARAWRSKLV